MSAASEAMAPGSKDVQKRYQVKYWVSLYNVAHNGRQKLFSPKRQINPLTVSRLNSTLLPVVRLITTTPGTPSECSQTPPTASSFSPITWAECEYLKKHTWFQLNVTKINEINKNTNKKVKNRPGTRRGLHFYTLPAEAPLSGSQYNCVSQWLSSSSQPSKYHRTSLVGRGGVGMSGFWCCTLHREL